MSDRYFISDGTSTLGPYTRQHLLDFLARAELGPHVLFCRENSKKWMPIGTLADSPLPVPANGPDCPPPVPTSALDVPPALPPQMSGSNDISSSAKPEFNLLKETFGGGAVVLAVLLFLVIGYFAFEWIGGMILGLSPSTRRVLFIALIIVIKVIEGMCSSRKK
jgi:hypothetical protein